MKIHHRNAHLRIWMLLAVLLTLGFGAGLALKQPLPIETGSSLSGGN
jgi:hypothetical protein